MKKIFLFVIIFSQLICLNAQTVSIDNTSNTLSGSLNIDSKISFDKSEKSEFLNFDNHLKNEKSIWLAVGLSALVPGAGEFYAESYLKSAVFVAVEAAAITLGLIYDKKGNDQTELFQNFAIQHWSVNRYAAWTIKHASSINSAVDPTKFNVFENGKVNWSELNRLESAIGSYYSHHLPKFGEQQYFELIGKYPQFNVGWDDFGDENTPFFYGDPLTARFLYYSGERGKANDFYNVASKAVLAVLINHIVSAVDAALTTNAYNRRLSANVSMERRDYGFNTVYYPQVNLQFRF